MRAGPEQCCSPHQQTSTQGEVSDNNTKASQRRQQRPGRNGHFSTPDPNHTTQPRLQHSPQRACAPHNTAFSAVSGQRHHKSNPKQAAAQYTLLSAASQADCRRVL